MAVHKISFLFVGYLLFGCESAFVDTLEKVSIYDGKSQRDLIQSVLPRISNTGIPELLIPPIDDLVIENINVEVFNMINITMVDGVVKGIKDCTVYKFETNIEQGHASMELLCDITIKGRYKVYSNSPLIKNLLGGDSIHGEGNGRVKFDKLYLKFDYYFDVQRHDGDTYIHCKFDKTIYSYDIRGRVAFGADNLYLGKEEASALIVDTMNRNWKLIMAAVGNIFFDRAMEIVYLHTHKFFDNVPTKDYILEDLSKYVVN